MTRKLTKTRVMLLASAIAKGTTALLVIFVCLGSGASTGAPLKIAVIYPKDDPKISSIGNEATCITEGLLSEGKRSGASIEYRFYDNERDPIKTVSVAEAIAKEKFDFAIGTVTSSEAIAAAKILNQAKIPFFATTATNPDVTKDKPHSFRLPFDDYHQARTLAQFVAKEQRAKKVAVVRNISLPYSEFLAVEFTSHLKSLDPKVVIDQFDIIEGFSQYGTLVDKIIASKADVIFVPIYAPDTAKLYNELAARPGKFSLVGGDTVGGRDSFFKVLKGTSQSISLTFAKSWADGPDGPEKEAFLKAHTAYCKDQSVTLISAAAYDVVRATLLGIQKNQKARGLDLISTIKNLGYHGLTGVFKHNKSGEPEKPLFLHKIENGRSIFWKKYP